MRHDNSDALIKPQSVVQVKQGDNLVVVTQPITQIVESVKVQDQKGVIKELESLGNNVYSLAGIPVGAYILDVIVDLESAKKGAYETILVILAQGQQPLPPQQIIQTVKISDDIRIIFPPDDNQTNPPEECEPGFVLVGDNCERIVCPVGSQLDPNGRICEPIPDPPCDPSSPECAPTQCPDGRIVPPGQQCPDDALPCDDPNAPEGCSVPTECPDGTTIPPGEQCPDVDYGEDIPSVPEEGEDNDSGNGNEDNGNQDNDNGDNGDNDNGSDQPADPPEESDNGDSGSGEFFD